ncbi:MULTISPECIES: GNAT family N-acetyltransferase [Gammaproteobacteria]|uniref:GNAT family N-acetyltransferase n=1 Tax=Gammaproteobacteria TaxID=1236 RepID=UPI000DCFEACE|nr:MULTISPECIES: GNAT family N-acetyltransferase [Gammaproteobacteria]RTE86249.1 GNAT family N-acetyltransferase [Aliidiomarina sp. B3213]TCZ91600.1 GNAT family N-acetyltransferase [Lysobacter sp. N42]
MENSQLIFRPMTAADETAVVKLANEVHGDNYLSPESFRDYLKKGTTQDGRNLNWLAFMDEELVGIRLTFAAGNWDVDEWCSPSEWNIPADKLCYFKCAAVSEKSQGRGVGKGLLYHAIVEAVGSGCHGGLAHIWRQSPNNSAFQYFSKCGGELVKDHPDRWLSASLNDGYYCPVCDGTCYCVAAEMILPFANIRLVSV